MEDRYELRGKIGQGGIGSVHRAYDHRMKREVAIKRILTSSEDTSLEAEATKQLMAEVGALASLQHPHIVTVFDVGSDEEGPYIVMELINGKTLDEIAENAPLVWHDFKIVAMQSLEALIAAQELNLIHSDLKPPNIMLTWLPSGAFQVKIVDFGLATLIHNQSQEEIEKLEAIYGSVFFMPPEQYERKTLDTRSDLYSLGCCFYQALTGTYPFNGTTGMEVMQAHLNHTVTPIQEIRNDLPLWACDWLMWLINRYPDDRPPSARDALSNFLQNDKETSPIMTKTGRHPRFLLPGASPSSATGPVTTKQPTAAVYTSVSPTSKYSFTTSGEITATVDPEVPGAPAKPKSFAKLLKIAIALISVALLGFFFWTGIKKYNAMQLEQAYNNIASTAERGDVKEIQISTEQLQVIFDFFGQAKPDTDLSSGYAALAKAKSTDDSNFDAIIAEFITSAEMPKSIRMKLFEQVIEKRRNVGAIPTMLKFSASAKDPEVATACFNTVRRFVREEHAEALLGVISATNHANIRKDAEAEMTNIITRSQNRTHLADLISKASQSPANPSAKPDLDRLLNLSKTP